MTHTALPALHAAIDRGHDALRRAIAEGADVEARDRAGQTPLHRAVSMFGGDRVAVELLLAAGADPTARTPEGRTVIETLRAGVSSALEAMEADEIEKRLREAEAQRSLLSSRGKRR